MAHCNSNHSEQRLRFGVRLRCLGKVLELQLFAASKEDAEGAFIRVAEEVRRIEGKFSFVGADSIIARINSTAFREEVLVDRETADLLSFCNKSFEESVGAFDIASGTLLELWGFSDFQSTALKTDLKNPRQPPSDNEIQSALHGSSTCPVTCSDSRVRLMKDGVRIDLSPILREFIVDKIAVVLTKNGFRSGFIASEGVIRILGPQYGGAARSLGIVDPRNTQKELHSVKLKEGALVTCGDYQRFFECDGVRYSPPIDPRSGYATAKFQSVSVVADSCMVAGVLAKVAMLSDLNDVQSLLERAKAPYILISSEGSLVRLDNARPAPMIPMVYKKEGLS